MTAKAFPEDEMIVSTAGNPATSPPRSTTSVASGTFGQLLPRDSFIQMQGGFAIPLEGGHDDEVFWRAAVGKSFEYPRFGRI